MKVRYKRFISVILVFVISFMVFISTYQEVRAEAVTLSILAGMTLTQKIITALLGGAFIGYAAWDLYNTIDDIKDLYNGCASIVERAWNKLSSEAKYYYWRIANGSETADTLEGEIEEFVNMDAGVKNEIKSKVSQIESSGVIDINQEKDYIDEIKYYLYKNMFLEDGTSIEERYNRKDLYVSTETGYLEKMKDGKILRFEIQDSIDENIFTFFGRQKAIITVENLDYALGIFEDKYYIEDLKIYTKDANGYNVMIEFGYENIMLVNEILQDGIYYILLDDGFLYSSYSKIRLNRLNVSTGEYETVKNWGLSYQTMGLVVKEIYQQCGYNDLYLENQEYIDSLSFFDCVDIYKLGTYVYGEKAILTSVVGEMELDNLMSENLDTVAGEIAGSYTEEYSDVYVEEGKIVIDGDVLDGPGAIEEPGVIEGILSNIYDTIKQGVVDIVNSITAVNENTVETDLTEDFRNYKLPDLFILILKVLLSIIMLIVRALSFLFTFYSIEPYTGWLHPDIAVGINYLKNYNLPLFGLNFFELINTVFLIIVGLTILRRVNKNIA